MDINLVLFKKNGSQKSFPMPSSITIIGRRTTCDLCIPLMAVSKKHCQLSYRNGRLKIRDLDSKNGTIINGNRIGEAEIKPGDAVKIGPLAFVFQINGKPEKPSPPTWAFKKTSQSEIQDNAADTAETLLDSSDDSFADIEDSKILDATGAPI